MRKTLAWLRRHPFFVLLALIGAGAATVSCLAASPRRIELDCFEQIKPGMTGAEVERILGGPEGFFGVPGPWVRNAWLRKIQKGAVIPQAAEWGERTGPMSTWLIVNFGRFSIVQIYFDDRGRVTGAMFAHYEH